MVELILKASYKVQHLRFLRVCLCLAWNISLAKKISLAIRWRTAQEVITLPNATQLGLCVMLKNRSKYISFVSSSTNIKNNLTTPHDDLIKHSFITTSKRVEGNEWRGVNVQWVVGNRKNERLIEVYIPSTRVRIIPQITGASDWCRRFHRGPGPDWGPDPVD